MTLDKKIISELNRYKTINKYILEQEATQPDPSLDIPVAEPEGNVSSDAEIAEPNLDIPEPTGDQTPIDPATDPDVEKVNSNSTPQEPMEETGTEELDITDLVTSQKNVEQKQEEYFTKLFSQLESLQTKLAGMDQIVQTLNTLETKIEKYREKTPQEKLELRSLDSYPYNQKLTDFFVDKQEDLQKSGKNEYVLTASQVKDFSPEEIKNSFNAPEEEDEAMDTI